MINKARWTGGDPQSPAQTPSATPTDTSSVGKALYAAKDKAIAGAKAYAAKVDSTLNDWGSRVGKNNVPRTGAAGVGAAILRQARGLDGGGRK